MVAHVLLSDVIDLVTYENGDQFELNDFCELTGLDRDEVISMAKEVEYKSVYSEEYERLWEEEYDS